MMTADSPVRARYSWAAYIVPMALFLAITAAEGAAPVRWYVAIYSAKAVLVTVALATGWRTWRADVRLDTRSLAPGVVVGLLVFAEWVVLDRWIPYPHLGQRTALNPFTAIPDPFTRAAFLSVRFYGLALMVPMMEELFWRDLALRWLTKPDYESVPVGTFSWPAFWIVAAAFAAAHPEWLVAAICAVAYGLLLRQTRSLSACIAAHAVTNLALGVYVVTTGQWGYW